MAKTIHYEIIDNILPEEFLTKLMDEVNSPTLYWKVATEYTVENEERFESILEHHGFEKTDSKFNNQAVLTFRDNYGFMDQISSLPIMYELLDILKEKLDFKVPLRMKLNMTLCGDVQRSFGWHIDDKELYALPTKTCILYLNTNNGYTLLENGTKVESIKNRLVVFKGTTWHTPINQTDTNKRLVLNFNYI